MRPLILVSNDDGVHAPGIVALREALASFADVITVAPKNEQSAKSHAITLHHPLRHEQHQEHVHSVDGTPVDCIYVALFRKDLLPRRPDLVVSGINHGPNLGSDVHYSGTVAAAREAALRRVPAIAFSMAGGSGPLEDSATAAAAITRRVLEVPHPDGQPLLLNVNFPRTGPFKGMRATRPGLRLYTEGVSVRDDPEAVNTIGLAGPAECDTSASKAPTPTPWTMAMCRSHHCPSALRIRIIWVSPPMPQEVLDMVELRSFIRDIPDFPKPGILFKDITPLLADPRGFAACLQQLADAVREHDVDAIVGMESRGFIFGAALAAKLERPFVPARKPGKLPAQTASVSYELEYGTDSLEMHVDALKSGDRVLIVDDLIATGGTAKATGELVRKVGGSVAAYAFVIELSFLNGRKLLGDADVVALVSY